MQKEQYIIAVLLSNNFNHIYMYYQEAVELLQKCRVSRHTQLAEQKFLLEVNGVKCFPRGDLVAISGKDKCGKTTVCRMLAAALLRGEYGGIKAREENLRILWIDTEQAMTSTRSVNRAIDLMCGFEPSNRQLFFVNLRNFQDKEQMRPFVRFLFDQVQPDFVVLDGIRDLIHDFNDVKESSDIVLECMRMAGGVTAEQAEGTYLHERKPCCIACVLHQNKTKEDNAMRGHLGTELANKAGEVWEATREDNGVFKFEQTRSRTCPVENPFSYKIHTEQYVDEEDASVEEVGIPEVFQRIADARSEEDGSIDQTMIKTSHYGTFAKNKENVQKMFQLVMQNQSLPWKTVLHGLCDTYGISWKDAASLKSIVPDNVVKDASGKLWKYAGPSIETSGVAV